MPKIRKFARELRETPQIKTELTGSAATTSNKKEKYSR
jgi:hypothetical protein